jgi:hypothetical protein
MIERFERSALARYCHIQRREFMTPVDHTLDRRAKQKYFQIINLTALELFSRKLTRGHIAVATGRVR